MRRFAVPTRPFTEAEIRSLLPSGWGIRSDLTWDARKRAWRVELYDVADQSWWLEIPERELVGGRRIEVLRDTIDRVAQRGLGRKSLLG